jgi:hypothetical protein
MVPRAVISTIRLHEENARRIAIFIADSDGGSRPGARRDQSDRLPLGLEGHESCGTSMSGSSQIQSSSIFTIGAIRRTTVFGSIGSAWRPRMLGGRYFKLMDGIQSKAGQ